MPDNIRSDNIQLPTPLSCSHVHATDPICAANCWAIKNIYNPKLHLTFALLHFQ